MGSRGDGARGRGRGRGRGASAWSVFDAVRSFPSTPEALMDQIDAAIAAHEYTHATSLLFPSPSPSPYPSSSPPPREDQDHDDGEAKEAAAAEEEVSAGAPAPAPAPAVSGDGAFDTRLADEAYRAACAALAAGRPGAAVRSLRVAIARCPPDKASALAKLHSLLAIASAQLQKQQKRELLR